MRKIFTYEYLVALIFLLLTTSLVQGLIIYAQADNNKQLIYDLNVSQTAFLIQSSQIAQGLYLPLLDIR